MPSRKSAPVKNDLKIGPVSPPLLATSNDANVIFSPESPTVQTLSLPVRKTTHVSSTKPAHEVRHVVTMPSKKRTPSGNDSEHVEMSTPLRATSNNMHAQNDIADDEILYTESPTPQNRIDTDLNSNRIESFSVNRKRAHVVAMNSQDWQRQLNELKTYIKSMIFLCFYENGIFLTQSKY